MTSTQGIVIGITFLLSWAMWFDFFELWRGRSPQHEVAIFVAIGGALIVFFLETRCCRR